ncbi:unnamed protein product [Echinostoma caproni]|uniref:MFS domain-containing protein n=1 Tax=Echinostoma caproni TaxID=27848 RepID=A0A183A938_9TREM|nr:unnamed protein product [Echinostoma caproni]
MSDDESRDAEPTTEEQEEIAQFLNVDNFLEEVVGSHGLWQWLVALFLMLTTPSPSTFPVYANSVGQYRCRMESTVEDYIVTHNLQFTQVAERIGPWSTVSGTNNLTGSATYGCSRYQLNWTSANLDQVFNLSVQTTHPTATTVEKCPYGYVYETNADHYPGNVVQEFNVICDQRSLQSFGTSMYMVGMLLGFLLGGWCGDRFGRCITLTAFSCVELLGTIVVSLAPNYAVYIIFRTVIGIGNTVKVSVGNVLVYEITVARYRSLYGSILALGLDFVFRAYMALCAYLIPQWRALNAAVMCTGALGLLYPLIVPESPRWLISRKQLRKAIKQMHRGCQINQRRKVVRDEQYFDELLEKATRLEERMKPMRENFVVTHPADLVLTICSNIGLVLVTTSVCMIYVYVAELYPSEIRSYAFGVVFAISRIGSIICPFINDLDESLSHGSPMVIYSAILILVVFALSHLPDTCGENLTDFLGKRDERTFSEPSVSQCELTDVKPEDEEFEKPENRYT